MWTQQWKEHCKLGTKVLAKNTKPGKNVLAKGGKKALAKGGKKILAKRCTTLRTRKCLEKEA